MPNQMLLTDRAELAIQLGEGHFREFKSAWDRSSTSPTVRSPRNCARDIAETLVAFANADGGELLLGVEDDGRISGVPHNEEQMQIILDAPRTHVLASTPLTMFHIATLMIRDQRVLYFQISKGTTQIHQTSDGRCLQRLNTENRPVPLEHIRYERLERRSREYDREFIDGASLKDLDQRLLLKAMEKITPGFAVDRALQYLNLLTYDGMAARLRRAALLLFADDINRWHPRSQVRIIRVVGNKLEVGPQYNVQRTEIVQGNVLALIEESWARLREYLAVERKAEEGLFRETILYPEEACREAIVNAIVHRDYSAEGIGIDIFVYNDRMEIISPGGLLSDVSLEALRRREKVHQSRNAYIARVLRELGYVRELGEGIPGIFHVLELHDLVPPELNASPHTFSITLHHESIFSPKDRAWLQSFEGIPLTRDEQRVLLFARDRKVVSPAEITRMLGIVDWDEYRMLIVKMQSKGLMFSTLTDAQISSQLRRQGRRVIGRRKREIPRLAVREPADCTRFVSELLIAVSREGIPMSINTKIAFTRHLSSENPYSNNPSLSLFALELLDEERKPTSRLLELLGRLSERRIQLPIVGKSNASLTNTYHHRGKMSDASTHIAVPPTHVLEKTVVVVPDVYQEAPAQSSLDLLIQELLNLLKRESNRKEGISLIEIRKNLSTPARATMDSFSKEGYFVDFLSRQRDRFALKWLRNTWKVFPASIKFSTR